MQHNTRLYRPRGTVDCPISKTFYEPKRIMPDYSLIHWHPDIELLYVEEGCFHMRADQQILKLSPGDIQLITPGQLHGLKCLTPSGKYWSIAFSPEFISLPETHFFQRDFTSPLQEGKLILPAVLRPTDSLYPKFFNHMQQILEYKETDPNYKAEVFQHTIALCTAVMPLCQRISAEERSLDSGSITVRTCVDYMQAHYAEKITLQQIADSVYLHPNYLCALFKEYTGQTVFHYLTRLRIQKAATLLRSQPISVSQAAEQCGFNSPSLFAQKFREFKGMTPKSYSKQHRQS